jgi:outer membrane protein TolC
MRKVVWILHSIQRIGLFIRGASNLLIRIVLLAALFFGIGCSPKLSFLTSKAEITESQKDHLKVKNNSELKTKNSQIDYRLIKIISSPPLLANKKSIKAAKSAVDVIESQKEAQISTSSNLGPRLDNNLKLDATAGLTLTKIINDGGILDAQADAANLNVKAAQLIYGQNINKNLMEVIKAEQAILNFKKIKAIYDEQVKVYNESTPLIESAVKANVISKTEALKLEQLKLRSEELYLNASTSSETSYIIRKKFNLTESDDFFHINANDWKLFKRNFVENELIKIKLIETQINILEKDIKGIEATFKANIAFAGNATANISDIDSSIGFLGLNITLPVKDGGRRSSEVEEKNFKISGLKDQKQEALLVNSSSFEYLLNFNKIYNVRSDLIEAQMGNSKIIAKDMELKLRAGAASVVDLATERMNLFDLKNQKAALEYQKIQEIIKFYETIGQECSLTAMCDQVNTLINSG